MKSPAHISERFLELALVRAIPDLTIGKPKPSRMKGLYARLQKEVDRDLSRLFPPTRAHILEAAFRINAFALATGWLNQQRHVGTLLSFCADLLEKSESDHNPKILETIALIVDHLEAGGDLPGACCWAGSVAMEKWREVTR